jgi:hypothetical protein
MAKRLSRRAMMGAGLSLAGAAGLGELNPRADGAEPAAQPGSPTPFARPLAQDYSVVFHNEDRQLYVEGCGLARLDDGTLIAAVPVVPRAEWTKEMRIGHSQIHLRRSRDGGNSWEDLARLPYYSAIPWVHADGLYLFAFEPGAKARNDNLLLLRSTDAGSTWSEPVTLFKGHGWNAHTGMVIREGHLYWAFDDIEKGTAEKRTTRVIAGDLSGDPLDPRAWRTSSSVAFPGMPEALSNPRFAKLNNRILEPSLIDVAGRLRVIASVKVNNQTTTNLGAVFDVHDDGKKLELAFTQFHPMPGGHLNFCIVADPVSKMFWATANFAVDAQESFDWWDAGRKRGNFRPTSNGGDDRRLLMLLYGLDGLNWFQAGCVAQAGKLSQSFMYARPVIDGNDLAIIARSSIDAPNQHDADYATFHRVKDFHRLALKLVPDPEV